METWFTPEQAAEQLTKQLQMQISPRRLRDWLRSGKISGQKFAGQWRLSPSDLQNFISNRKEDKTESTVLSNADTMNIPRPSKESSDYEWEIYGRKVFEEMRKEGMDKYFQGIYIAGEERYKSYEYKGESFRLFFSANEMRIIIQRPNTFLAPGGSPEDWDIWGIDVATEVLLYSAARGEFNQQAIKDSRRTKE